MSVAPSCPTSWSESGARDSVPTADEWMRGLLTHSGSARQVWEHRTEDWELGRGLAWTGHCNVLAPGEAPAVPSPHDRYGLMSYVGSDLPPTLWVLLRGLG